METKDYLEYIVNQIHSTVVTTVDDDGLPVTCAIDMMDYDDNSLYFLTAKGKRFYNRLKKKGYVTLTGMKGKDTISCLVVLRKLNMVTLLRTSASVVNYVIVNARQSALTSAQNRL